MYLHLHPAPMKMQASSAWKINRCPMKERTVIDDCAHIFGNYLMDFVTFFELVAQEYI